MSLKLLDNPAISSTLFFPQKAAPHTSAVRNAVDGSIPVEENITLGYRLYPHQKTSPLVVMYHGNGEIAAQYDFLAQEYHKIGLSLMVIDFRGYGWSEGVPQVSNLLGDVEGTFEGLDNVLAKAQLQPEGLYIKGRSLGSAPAIEMAAKHPEAFRGLIIESGFAVVMHLLKRRGFPESILGGLPDPIGNLRKVKTLDLPLLVIHGERDQLIPVSHGQDLYGGSPHPIKRILRAKNSGHNDLLFNSMSDYFAAIVDFVDATS